MRDEPDPRSAGTALHRNMNGGDYVRRIAEMRKTAPDRFFVPEVSARSFHGFGTTPVKGGFLIEGVPQHHYGAVLTALRDPYRLLTCQVPSKQDEAPRLGSFELGWGYTLADVDGFALAAIDLVIYKRTSDTAKATATIKGVDGTYVFVSVKAEWISSWDGKSRSDDTISASFGKKRTR